MSCDINRLREEVATRSIVAYCRISKGDANSYESLNRQKDICKYAARRLLGKECDDIVTEVTSGWRLSRTRTYRTGFHSRDAIPESLDLADKQQTLLRWLKNSRHSIFIVSAPDRFTRNSSKLQYYLELAAMNDIVIVAMQGVSYDEAIVWDPRSSAEANEVFVDAIHMADAESANLSRRLRTRNDFIKQLAIDNNYIPFTKKNKRWQLKEASIIVMVGDSQYEVPVLVLNPKVEQMVRTIYRLFDELFPRMMERIDEWVARREEDIAISQEHQDFHAEFNRGANAVPRQNPRPYNEKNRYRDAYRMTIDEIYDLIRNNFRLLASKYRIRKILKERENVLIHNARENLQETFNDPYSLPALVLNILQEEDVIRNRE